MTTRFALHGSPVQVELVPGRLLRALALPVLGRLCFTLRNVGFPTSLRLQSLYRKIVRIPIFWFLVNSSFVPNFPNEFDFFSPRALGVEKHPRMGAGGSSGHGRPGERETPNALGEKSITISGKLFNGWMTGFEPATTGTTNQGSTAELHPPFLKHLDPGGIRTPDQLLRRQLLYPAELPGRIEPTDSG